MSPANQTHRGTPAALSCSDTTAGLCISPFVRGGELCSPSADRGSKISPSLLPAFVCGAVTAGVGDRCTFPPCQLFLWIWEQEPDLPLFPQPYCHLNPSDRILAVPRGQERPVGALEGWQSLKAEKMKMKSRAGVLRGEWGWQRLLHPTNPAGICRSWDFSLWGKAGCHF